MKKPNLLFISPVLPGVIGWGLALRAGIVTEALAHRYRVHVLHVPTVEVIPPVVADWCEQIRVLPAAVSRGGSFRYTTPDFARQAAELYADVEFDHVHVFRLYLAQFAGPYLEAGVPCSLDIDDLDSVCLRRIAAINKLNADKLRAEADRCAREEKTWIPRFSRVFVASEVHRQQLPHPHVEVLPNAVRMPSTFPPATPGNSYCLLFFGLLGYYPNEDAVFHFCEEILPLLRGSTPVPVRFLVAGRNPGKDIVALDRLPDVTVLGEVADPAVCYEQADAAVVPIRAGGGTRLKILEAAAFRRPVISTSIGAEGLSAKHGAELLIADSPVEFARQCRLLMNDAALRDRLVERAFAWVGKEHSLDRVRQVLSSME